MRSNEIKAELIRRGISMTTIAEETGTSVQQVSMCISGAGIYLEIRRVIARHLERPINRVFGSHHPKPKRSDWCKAA